MDFEPQVMEVIRKAFTALERSHPDVLVRISSAIEASHGDTSRLSIVEAAFRDAGKALLTTDKGAAQTLFRVAETLAEFHWQ
jgi:hypothetical protein